MTESLTPETLRTKAEHWDDGIAAVTAEALASALERLEATARLRPEAKRLISLLDNAVPNPGWRTRFLSLLAALAREETSHEA